MDTKLDTKLRKNGHIRITDIDFPQRLNNLDIN